MTKTVDSEVYLNTTEAIKFFDAPKQRFYDVVKPQLPVYRFDGKKSPWYKKSDMEAIKLGKSTRKADISIRGMFADWTQYLETLGYDAQTMDDTREIAVLPEEAVRIFKLSPDRKFFKRERMSYASGTPICIWSTYYPVDLINDVLPQLLDGEPVHIIEHIKEMRNLIIKDIDERYTARLTTFEELVQLQLHTEQAVLTLQRASYTKGEKELILYSDMVLLGNWFDVRRKDTVNHWD